MTRPTTRSRVTALISSLALALGLMTAAAAPARANEDLGKFIAGVAAVALIGTALNKADKRHDRREHAAPPPPPRHARPHRPQYQPPRYAPPPRHARPQPQHHRPRYGHERHPRGAYIR